MTMRGLSLSGYIHAYSELAWISTILKNLLTDQKSELISIMNERLMSKLVNLKTLQGGTMQFCFSVPHTLVDDCWTVTEDGCNVIYQIENSLIDEHDPFALHKLIVDLTKKNILKSEHERNAAYSELCEVTRWFSTQIGYSDDSHLKFLKHKFDCLCQELKKLDKELAWTQNILNTSIRDFYNSQKSLDRSKI